MQNKEKEILSITQEECAEVVQAISKVNRFGIDAMHNGATNRERLTEETGDLFCMIELLIEFGLIDRNEMILAAGKKREKLSKWSNIFQEENA